MSSLQPVTNLVAAPAPSQHNCHHLEHNQNTTRMDAQPDATMDVVKLRNRLVRYGQEHLLDHWDTIAEEEQASLYRELADLDLDEVTEDFKRTTMNIHTEKLDDRMQPLSESQTGSVLKATDRELGLYSDTSMEEISSGKVAILLLAGGQGTRLGVNYPKGMYNVGLPSGKTLFQLQAERIVSLQRLAEARTGKAGSVVWYIMTSAATVTPTTRYFQDNDYFGLRPENVVVFQQGTLPCFTFGGKIILGSKHSLSRAPDGNGGLYRALRVEGILENMKRRGVKYIQLYCVDNILVKVGDPVFMGYCIAKGAECANKVVPKGFPEEKVGITCKVDGHYQVVEYSEITQKSSERRNRDGSLTFGAANLCIHFFTFDFLERVVMKNERALQHHIAKKKIPYVDADGVLVKPENPNGIKMEKFVFDVFRFAKNFVVWECFRDEEFAPLKNAEGASDFTPTHCRLALLSLHQKWLRMAGVKLVNKEGEELPQMVSPAGENNNNSEDNNNIHDKKNTVLCEISPLLCYSGEGLKTRFGDKTLTPPFVLS